MFMCGLCRLFLWFLFCFDVLEFIFGFIIRGRIEWLLLKNAIYLNSLHEINREIQQNYSLWKLKNKMPPIKQA